MANYHEDIVNIELESGNIHRSFLHHSIGAGDDRANRFGVRVFRNGVPENVSGSCFGLFIRADGETVPIDNGVVSGNVAYVTLPDTCYAVEGQFCLTIKVSTASDTTTLRIVDGVVSRTSTNVIVDPGTIIPSVEILIAEIEAAIASIPADYSELWASLAPVFNPDATTPYRPGDYVRYNGKLYVCKATHTGAWASGDFTVTPLSEGIKEIYKIDPERTKLSVAYEGNMLANATWTDGSNINADGSIGTSYPYMTYSSLIRVSPALDYVFSIIPRGRTATTRIHAYDANGNWLYQITYISLESVSIGECKAVSFTPTNATFVRISTCIEYKNNVFMGQKFDIESIQNGLQVHNNIDTNIARNATWTEGKYINENGEITDHDYMKISSLIAISHPMKHTIIVVPSQGIHEHRIHGYDANGNWIRELASIPSTSQTAGVAYIRTFFAVDCDYIRFSIGKTTDTVWLIDEDTDVQAVLNASMKSEYSAMSNAVNILDGVEWTQHYNIDDDGQIVASANFEYSSLVPIKSNTGYTLSLANLDLAHEGNIRIIGYDDSETFVKVLQVVPYANISAGQTMWRIFTDGCSNIRVSKSINEKVAISEGNQLQTALLDSLLTKGEYSFEQGSINYLTGLNLERTSRIRTPTYGDLSARIISSDRLLFAVYLYDRDASFIGVWDGSKAITGVTTWLYFVDMNTIYEKYKADHPNLLYRIVARELNNSQDIIPSTGKYVHFYTRSDNLLYATIGTYLTWAVCGASYDAGHYTNHSNTYDKAWCAVLARRCGNTLTNYSFAGATTKSFIESTTTHSLTQALSDPAKELYVLTYGGNDATHPDEVPVGSITDITGHTSGTPWNSTFYGNYGQIIESLMAHAPNAKFVMTTPSSPWYSTAQVTIDNAIREIAEHYNLPMIEWESDDFMRSDLFIKTMSGGHPVPITYSGMALAFERLFSKCVIEYADYFTAME